MAKKKEPEKENHERWLVTYADLMNLLLILFIILFASSQLDKSKAEKVAESVRAGFGGYVQDGGSGAADGTGTGLYGSTDEPSDVSPIPGESQASNGNSLYWSQESAAYKKFYDDVVKLIEENGLQTMVDVSLDDRGVVISFRDYALYSSGQADLGIKSLYLIDSIGALLKTLNFSFILVEGHTDSDPIHTSRYIDNMDLSTQRAANVWRELVKCGLPAVKMASIGYGENRPIAPNNTPENKSKNRRVVVTILRSDITSSEEIISGAAETEETHETQETQETHETHETHE